MLTLFLVICLVALHYSWNTTKDLRVTIGVGAVFALLGFVDFQLSSKREVGYLLVGLMCTVTTMIAIIRYLIIRRRRVYYLRSPRLVRNRD